MAAMLVGMAAWYRAGCQVKHSKSGFTWIQDLLSRQLRTTMARSDMLGIVIYCIHYNFGIYNHVTRTGSEGPAALPCTIVCMWLCQTGAAHAGCHLGTVLLWSQSTKRTMHKCQAMLAMLNASH